MKRGLALFLVAVLALLAHRDSYRVGPVGQDTLILVDSSQVEGPADWPRLFAQELRRGIRPSTAFYRPLVNLSFAVDDAVAPDSWPQLHRTSMAWHALASVALALLLLRLGLPLGWATAGAVVFALHPLAIEVVPAPARRGESMVAFLLASACVAWPETASRRRLLLACGLGALAPLAKESGFVLPLLWAAMPGWGNWKRRGLTGVAVIAPALVMRSVVLAGAGGYAHWGLQLRGLFDAGLDLLDPFRLSTGWGVRLLLLLLLCLFVLEWRRNRRRGALNFGAAWTVAAFALLPLARGIAPWYLYLPLVGAIVVSTVTFYSASRELGGWFRAGAMALAGVLLLLGLRASPMWVDYPEWKWAGDETARLLRASQDLPANELEDPWVVLALPREFLRRPSTRFRVRSATVVVDDTLRAWWRLRHGVDLQVECGLDLSLDSPRALPTRASYDDTGSLRVYAPPGATLVASKWPGPDRVELRASGSSAVLTGRVADRWLWTGEEFLRLPPPRR